MKRGKKKTTKIGIFDYICFEIQLNKKFFQLIYYLENEKENVYVYWI